MRDGTSEGERGNVAREGQGCPPCKVEPAVPAHPPLHTLCHASLLAIPKSPALVTLPFFPIAPALDCRMATSGAEGVEVPQQALHTLCSAGGAESDRDSALARRPPNAAAWAADSTPPWHRPSLGLAREPCLCSTSSTASSHDRVPRPTGQQASGGTPEQGWKTIMGTATEAPRIRAHPLRQAEGRGRV